jgi:glycosyltransferase involved in cell wall biosynthesis
MRVGLVIYGSLDTVSGGYLYDRQLVNYLERQGHRVEIISLPWHAYSLRLMDNLSLDLQRRMGRNYDLLLQDELNHPSLAWANGRLGRARPPIVSIVHHLRSSEARPRWQNWLYGLVERCYLRSVDAFIYNSHTTRRAVEALAGSESPHVVAYPGGDRLVPGMTEVDVSSRAWNGPLRLLFVGNLIPRKGLHVLLSALARVRADWRLIIVGSPATDPAYVRRVRRRAEKTLPGGRIRWLGSLSDAALAGEMAAAHVLAVPSDYEGFGIVYVEGMSFGLPALATTAGAAGEIVADGVDGFLVAPRDAAALAGHIETLARDRALLAGMGAAALIRYARHPTWAETSAAAGDFLRRVADLSEN